MKAVILRGPLDLAIEEVPKPHIGPNDVLLKMKAVGICGTDMHIYQNGPSTKRPLTLGHEFVGAIEEVGESVDKNLIGKKAVAEHVLGCGNCLYCKKDQKNLCQKRIAFGINSDGALQEYMKIPLELIHVLPNNFSYDLGVLVEPLTIGVYSAQKGEVKKEDLVAVVGLGPIGLFVSSIATSLGATVYGFDILPDRLDYAEKKKYIKKGINTKDPDFTTQFIKSTQGADVSFEVVGMEQTLYTAISLTRSGGRVVVLGIFKKNPAINMMDLVKREIHLIGSYTSVNIFAKTINLLSKGKIDTAGFITHRYPIDEVKKAFDENLKYPAGRIKTIIEF